MIGFQAFARLLELRPDLCREVRFLAFLVPSRTDLSIYRAYRDRIYRKTVAELFSGDFKAMDVLKHKDVIEEMENALDSLEGVANTIESIVLKQA